MQDRERIGLTGPVWRMYESHADSSSAIQEFEFDTNGNLRKPARPIERREESGGLIVEVEQAGGLDGWTMDGMHGVYFMTRGASVVETTYSAAGEPVNTILKNADGEELSRVDYVCDAEGRMVEARQRSHTETHVQRLGSALLALAPEAAKEAIGDFPLSDNDLRVAFLYDEAGRVAMQSTYSGDSLSRQLTWTYNKKGDEEAFTCDGERMYWFEYEYDAQGNWVRKIIHHSAGHAEITRTFIYYDSGH